MCIYFFYISFSFAVPIKPRRVEEEQNRGNSLRTKERRGERKQKSWFEVAYGLDRDLVHTRFRRTIRYQNLGHFGVRYSITALFQTGFSSISVGKTFS